MASPRPFLNIAAKLGGRVSARTQPGPAEGLTRIYRGQAAWESGGKLPDWVLDNPRYKEMASIFGRWWSDSLQEAQWYSREAGGRGQVLFQDIPNELVERFRVSNLPFDHKARAFSQRPDKELFLPAGFANRGQIWEGFDPLMGPRPMPTHPFLEQ